MKIISIWQSILAYLATGTQLLSKSFEPRPATDTVAFSISFIALAAKLAKADGTVTRNEVRIFRRIFEIPPEEEANAAHVFNLCRQETTGYQSYARKMSKALECTPNCNALKEYVLDGLFHIAMADGAYHPAQEFFLKKVAEVFGLNKSVYLRLRARHVPEFRDLYSILGVSPNISLENLRLAKKLYVRQNHPDQLISKGLPTEMVELANARLASFNNAYDEIVNSLD